MGGIEIVAVNERVVDDHRMGAPSGMPAPTGPAAPSAAKIGADTDARPEVEEDARPRPRGPVPTRIRIVERRSPEPPGVVHRHVDRGRIGRFNLNGRRASFGNGSDRFLRGGVQFARLLRLLPQPLDRVHDFRLLGQEGVAEVGSPGNVVVEPFEDVRKDHQRLNAGVPILLLGGLCDGGTGKARIALRPLIRLHHLQRICGRHHDLAEQRIGVQRDRRHQILQLLRSERLIRRW